jgi:hypothetical protein
MQSAPTQQATMKVSAIRHTKALHVASLGTADVLQARAQQKRLQNNKTELSGAIPQMKIPG